MKLFALTIVSLLLAGGSVLAGERPAAASRQDAGEFFADPQASRESPQASREVHEWPDARYYGERHGMMLD